MNRKIFGISFLFLATLVIFASCGKDDEEVTITTSCVIQSIQNEGTAQERDISGCWEHSALETQKATMKQECEDGTMGGTAGTFAETVCPSITAGIQGCEGIKTKYGGTATIWYTGAYYQTDDGKTASASQCTGQLSGTVTTKS